MINAMRRQPIRALVLLLCLSFGSVALQAQTAVKTADASLLPGPEPRDAPADWKKFVGVYEYTNGGKQKQTVIILERDQKAYMHSASAPDEQINFWVSRQLPDSWPFLAGLMSMYGAGKSGRTFYIYAPPGRPGYFTYSTESYVRADAGADPAHYFRITPTTPVEQLRAAALAAKPPTEGGPFRKPDLVELAPLDPAIHLDIRYAQSNNFLGTPVYTQARAFLQRPAAEALLRVLHKLQPLEYGLLIHDGYRPWYVTKIFWDATPAENHNFVADPQKGSRHNRGCAVDLTLYDLSTGKPVEMPGLYDEMTPRSFPDFQGGTSLQRWHRDLLRRAMESEGFTVNEDEWWHFDYEHWKQYPILNVAFEKLQ
jgi:D-alanyl-D-alanine dipeptidase